MISVSQCTPERSLPITMKTVNPAISTMTHPLKTMCLIRVRSCRIAVGITVMTSIVVDSMKDEDSKPHYMLVKMGEEIEYKFVAVP